MKKNEVVEKGKREGYLLISEISEIAKECHATKEDVLEFQKELQKDIRRYFDKINNLKAHKDIKWKEVTDKRNHGRTEKRSYYLSYNIETIKDKKKWETVKAIAYVRVERTEEDETSITDNYYIIDYKIEIDKFEIEEKEDGFFVTIGSGSKNGVIAQKLLNLEIQGFEFASRNSRKHTVEQLK